MVRFSMESELAHWLFGLSSDMKLGRYAPALWRDGVDDAFVVAEASITALVSVGVTHVGHAKFIRRMARVYTLCEDYGNHCVCIRNPEEMYEEVYGCAPCAEGHWVPADTKGGVQDIAVAATWQPPPSDAEHPAGHVCRSAFLCETASAAAAGTCQDVDSGLSLPCAALDKMAVRGGKKAHAPDPVAHDVRRTLATRWSSRRASQYSQRCRRCVKPEADH